ncbi:N-acetylmuramoyl-L-alanine amidase [Streptomyces sp. CC208A]|uniref:peptidoglycan recognition protein family protein n=1 Tax=Streptomyces sp. CC208A TaxID=3044573 RepID=UPI0024A8B5F6|nr:N-acetylmuramoyl-L-alanine amidase [Streptomyces sp. CC208A]
MAWYPGAIKMELQPESDQQPAIRPTQFIVHSIIAPWTARRTYEYWRDSTNLESHFGLGYKGDLGQYIGTETRADANYRANRRDDGTGAVSIETASNTSGSDPWTPAQVEQLIELGVWLHERHGIPLRICRTHDDPGFGYHRLHPEWAASGTSCPGDARVKQFREVVFPGIVARATGTEEDDMTPEERKLLTDTAAAVKRIEAKLSISPWLYKQPGIPDTRDMNQILRDIDKAVRGLRVDGLTPAQTDALAKKLAAELAARLAN